MQGATPDRLSEPVARRQHGAFSRSQAFSVGFTARMVWRRLESGAWIRLDASVYALGSHPFSWERQAMAATLSASGAVLSGKAAAALHGLAGYRRGGIEITVPRASKAKTPLASVRRSDFMQTCRVRGIPCMTVAHTILSMAARSSAQELDRAVDDVVVRGLVSLDEIQDRFATWAPRRRPGVDRLRRILASKGGGHVPPGTELERMLRDLLTADGLPDFAYEYELPWWPVGEGRVDAYAPTCSLIVEADGRAWHTRERDFVKDRRRDNVATAHGHATLRFSYVDLRYYANENRSLVAQTVATRAPQTIEGPAANRGGT